MVFKVHAIVHDAAEPVKSNSNKGTGYCYFLPEFPISYFLGHVTGFFVCFYITIFALLLYALFNF